MLTAALLGVPLVVWGCLCSLVAAVYLIYSPRPGGAGRRATDTAWRRLVLRWFHPLVWLLLGLSFFMWGGYVAGGAALAIVLAVASLITYAVFIGTFIRERKSRGGQGPDDAAGR